MFILKQKPKYGKNQRGNRQRSEKPERTVFVIENRKRRKQTDFDDGKIIQTVVKKPLLMKPVLPQSIKLILWRRIIF